VDMGTVMVDMGEWTKIFSLKCSCDSSKEEEALLLDSRIAYLLALLLYRMVGTNNVTRQGTIMR
jgi:hypothetical protein